MPLLRRTLFHLDCIAEMRNRHNLLCCPVRLTAGVSLRFGLLFRLKLCCSLSDCLPLFVLHRYSIAGIRILNSSIWPSQCQSWQKTLCLKCVEATFSQKKCLLNLGNLNIMAVHGGGLGLRSVCSRLLRACCIHYACLTGKLKALLVLQPRVLVEFAEEAFAEFNPTPFT